MPINDITASCNRVYTRQEKCVCVIRNIKRVEPCGRNGTFDLALSRKAGRQCHRHHTPVPSPACGSGEKGKA